MPRSFRIPPSVIVAGLCLAALHVGCASLRGPDADSVAPTVWSARLPDSGQLLLVGSVRLDTPGADLGPVVEWAWSDASELVLEVDPSRYGQREVNQAADRYGRIPPPATLRDRLTPETEEQFEFYLARRGFSAAPFEQLQPWVVTAAVTAAEFQALGYAPDQGVDRVLLARAGDRKPVASLETLESRFSGLAELPEGVQDLMLREMLERTDDFAGEAADLSRAWRRGDEAELERILFPHIDLPEFAALYESVVFERNRHMAERMAVLAGDGKTRLVVVGAAHMLGDRGIPALLAARGFEVQKVSAQ